MKSIYIIFMKTNNNPKFLGYANDGNHAVEFIRRLEREDKYNGVVKKYYYEPVYKVEVDYV